MNVKDVVEDRLDVYADIYVVFRDTLSKLEQLAVNPHVYQQNKRNYFHCHLHAKERRGHQVALLIVTRAINFCATVNLCWDYAL